jgi:hypothetical protein
MSRTKPSTRLIKVKRPTVAAERSNAMARAF